LKIKEGGEDLKDLSIALLQIHSKQRDIQGNLTKILDRISGAAQRGANLIVTPEVVLSGFLFSREDYMQIAQTIPGPATEEVGMAARKGNMYVILGLPEKSGQDLYNSLAVIGPRGGLVAIYRKTHLYLDESKFFKPGSELCLFKTEFGKVSCIICYDFVFPEFVRTLAANGASIITHSTGWLTTEDRDFYGKDLDHYHAIVRVRAWENQVYFASCCRCGNDENFYFFANSCVAAPWGALVGKLGEAEGTLLVKTDWAKLGDWRQLAPYWEDRRPELYKKILDL